MSSEPNEDDDSAELHEQFIDCLYGLYGPEESEAEELMQRAIDDAGGDLQKAEAALGDRFEAMLQEIYDVLDNVAPDRVATLLAYELLRDKIGGGEKDDKSN